LVKFSTTVAAGAMEGTEGGSIEGCEGPEEK
jgi:hypothetical protein